MVDVNSENVQPLQIPIVDVIPKIGQPLIIPHVDKDQALPKFNLNFVFQPAIPTPRYLFLWQLLKTLKLMAMMIPLF